MPDKVITTKNWLLFGLTINQHRKAMIILRHTFTCEKKLIQQIIFPQMTHCLNILAKRAQYFFPLNCIPLCNKMVNNQSMYAYDNKEITWLFEGILFICARVVSFVTRARSARAANDTARAKINNIPEKSHVIIIIKKVMSLSLLSINKAK